MSNPALGDYMIVDDSSPLCDEVENTPTSSLTVQGGKVVPVVLSLPRHQGNYKLERHEMYRFGRPY